MNLTAALSAEATLFGALNPGYARLTAAMGANAALAGPLTPQVGDLFADRLLVGLPHTEDVDLTQTSVEAGESTDGMVRTAWREVGAGDMTRLRVAATGTGTRVAVWRQTLLSIESGDEPAPINLERVGGTGLSDLTVDLDPSWPAHYVQFGVTAGDGADVSIVIEDATPPPSGTFDDATDIYGESGWVSVDTTNASQEAGEPDPAGMSPAATAWLRWESPDPAPGWITFEMPAVGDVGTIGLAIYAGESLGTLVQVASATAPAADGVQAGFSPAGGTVYYVQVATTDDHNVYEVMWREPAEAAEPQIPAQPYDFLRVEVYDRDATTLITEVRRRTACEGVESLNTPGMGSLSVPLNDPLLRAYSGLLRAGRFVKFWLGDTCISGFRIQNKTSVWVSSGEFAGMVQTVSGPTVHYLLNDMVVHHDFWPPRPDSPDTRYYSWASHQGAGADRWHDPDDWDAPINADSQEDPPGHSKRPPKKRAKYGQPKKWPDPDSLWVWMSSDADKNEGGYDPPRPVAGRKYYRKNFRIKQDGTAVRLYVTSDHQATVYVDGDEVIHKDSKGDKGYRTFTKANLILNAGVHNIAIFVRSRNSPSGDGTDAMMFTMYNVGEDGKRDDVILRSDRTWQAYYGRGVPGWHRAQVLKNSIQEARDRGNTAADLLTLGFDGLTDSEGKAWTDRFNQEIQIGTSGLDLQAQLSESGKFDVWVDPEDLTLHAYKRRGKNRSASVALTPGVNLLDYAAEQQDEIGNYFLTQFDGGFTTVEARGSQRTYGVRETYVELGGAKDEDTAKDIVRGAIAAFRDFRSRSGAPGVVLHARRSGRSGSLVAVPGMYPFLDFNVGDIISSPDEDGRQVPQRVLSLAFKEDSDGQLTFDPDLEQVAPPAPIGESL